MNYRKYWRNEVFTKSCRPSLVEKYYAKTLIVQVYKQIKSRKILVTGAKNTEG